MSNTKKKTGGGLFNNEKFLFVFSLLVSFAVWIAVAAGSGESVTYTVPDVPVNIELSENAIADGLTVVSIDDVPIENYSVSVKVSGNSVTVGSLTASDIQVYGTNLGNIVTSGTYNVSLAARPVGVKSNYNISSLSPTNVTVVVDRNVEKTFEIESQISASSPADYYMGSPTFSSKTVTVKGPEQSVSRVVRAVVSRNVDRELTETMVMENQNVILLDSDGVAIEDSSLIVEPATVDVTIPVLTKKTVPIVLNCENKPNGLAIDNFVKIEPAKIEIAATEDIIDSIESISIGTLDFNKLAYGTDRTSFEITMPEGVRNINNVEKATVSFRTDGFTSIVKQVSSFQFTNVQEGLTAQYSPYSNIQVRIVGPSEEISKIKTSDIIAVIDMSGVAPGTSDMPVNVRIMGLTSCWVYGSYNINVTVYEGDAPVQADTEEDTEGSNGSQKTDE